MGYIAENQNQNQDTKCCSEMVYKNSSGEWVYGVEVTVEWYDEDLGYGDEDIYHEEHLIEFCPYCGRVLRGEVNLEN